MSYAEWSVSTEETGRVGQDIMKGVYYALVLTVSNRRKISNRKSETKQRECHEGVLYTCLCYCIAIGASCCAVSYGSMVRRLCLHIRRGVLRCSSSTCKAFPTASNREASNSAGLHAFFMSCWNAY